MIILLTLKRKKIMFKWFLTRLLHQNITLLNKILKKGKNSITFTKMSKFHCQLNKGTSNASTAGKDTSKLMHPFIPITEVALKRSLRWKCKMKWNKKEKKNWDQWEAGKSNRLSKKLRELRYRLFQIKWKRRKRH